MITSVEVRSNLKRIVDQISALAHEASVKLTNGSNALEAVNKLVKNSITLTFTIGELYALEGQANTENALISQSKSNNYYNVRDNRGKFTRVNRV